MKIKVPYRQVLPSSDKRLHFIPQWLKYALEFDRNEFDK